MSPIILLFLSHYDKHTSFLDTKGILRLIQSVPSKKAEPFKMWLAEVGNDRLNEIADPEKEYAILTFVISLLPLRPPRSLRLCVRHLAICASVPPCAFSGKSHELFHVKQFPQGPGGGVRKWPTFHVKH